MASELRFGRGLKREGASTSNSCYIVISLNIAILLSLVFSYNFCVWISNKALDKNLKGYLF